MTVFKVGKLGKLALKFSPHWCGFPQRWERLKQAGPEGLQWEKDVKVTFFFPGVANYYLVARSCMAAAVATQEDGVLCPLVCEANRSA